MHHRLCRLALLTLTFALATVTAASGYPAASAPHVRLGLVATFSGEGFRAGRDALEAARIAVENANRAGFPTVDGKPCRVSLFVADDKASPQGAAQAVTELITHKKVMAVIGPYPSGLANAAALAAEAAGVPLLAPAATAAVVTAGRPHVFRIAFTDAFQGAVLGRLARNELHLGRVTVVANRDSLSSTSLAEAFVQAFTACGGQARIVFYEAHNRDFTDLMRQQALTDKPDGLFLPNASKESVLLALAARREGFTGALFGGDAWDGPEVSRLTAFDGAYFVDHWREDAPGEHSKAYVAAFHRERKHPPTELGSLTLDAVGVVLAAVQQAGSADPEAVTRALIDLPPYDGVTGRFDFIDDGNPVKSLFISRVTGGGTKIETHVVAPPGPCPAP